MENIYALLKSHLLKKLQQERIKLKVSALKDERESD